MTGIFGDFEDDFKNTPEAEHGSALGMVPEGVYKVVCSQQDPSGSGVMIDHEIFEAKSGTKGYKLFLEIVEPVEMPDGAGGAVKTQGEIIEHVFWVTQKNIGFLKRDVKTILGRALKTISELETLVWLGKTCEVGIKHDTYQGYKSSKVSYINEWRPKGGQPAAASAPAAAAAPTPPVQASAPPAAGAGVATPAGDPDF